MPKQMFDSANLWVIRQDQEESRCQQPTQAQMRTEHWCLCLVQGEPQHSDFEMQFAGGPVITVPTISLEGDTNGAPHEDPAAYRNAILKYVRRTLTGSIELQPASGSTASVCSSRNGR